MRDLHEELTALSVEWPATPDLAAAVIARLEAPAPAPRPARARAPRAWRPALAYALAALAAGFALTMAASPDARSAVLEWLGLKSVKIERREPSAPPPRPGKLGSGLGLGTLVTLAEAREHSPFLRVPRGGRARAARRGLGRHPRGLARLRRAPGLRPLDDDRRRRARAGVPRRASGSSSRSRSAPGRGWSGCASAATPRTSSPAPTASPTRTTGEVDFEEQRLAGNTLLVERADGLLIRVEGDLARDRAVAIAESIQ